MNLTKKQLDTIRESLSPTSQTDLEKIYREMIDATHEPAKVFHLVVSPSDVLACMDPTMYNHYLSVFIDNSLADGTLIEIDGNLYLTEEIYKILREEEGQIDE